jgi:c-di-GMP-binding flagellar brake protein YcgR
MREVTSNTGVAIKKPPVVITSNVHNQLNRILGLLTSKEFIFSLEADHFSTAFQMLHRFGGGVLVLAIDNPKDLAPFHKALTLLLAAIPQQNIRILLFSRRHEVLDSRALAQFQFIRPYQPAKSTERILEVIRREYKSLTGPDGWISPKPKAKTIDHALSNVVVYSNPEQKVEDPLLECLGESVVSHLYPLGLAWRVRGHFESYDRVKGDLTFRVESESAENRLARHFEKIDYVISSSSAVKGRICLALEITREGHRKFIFRLPRVTKVIQRRDTFRKKIPATDNAFGKIFDPSKKSTRLFSLVDFGAGGAGFFVDSKTAMGFQVGQKVDNAKLFLYNKEYVVQESEVRHISRSDVYTNLVFIGLKFLKINRADKAQIEILLFASALS